MESTILALSMLILFFYALLIPIILNKDDKAKHIKWSTIGLKNILKHYDILEIDVKKVAQDVQLFYDEYVHERPTARKYFPNSISWIDTIILRINIELPRAKCLEEYYEMLRIIRDYLNISNPYSSCSQNQQGILNDISNLKKNENESIIENIISRTESEFMRLEGDIKKNERSNKLSLMIGILGIAVSIFLAVVKF